MTGAIVEAGRTRFRVWAPRPKSIELEIVAPQARRVAMKAAGDGWFEAVVDGAGKGTRYHYLLDGERRRPDPASRAQPEGVHGPSEVDDPRSFAWQHPPRPRSTRELAIYELHVGTFTPEGTFDAATAQLDRLVDLGITAVEILPVASFSGERNWGYDGVDWFAPQQSYGGPDGLRRLVDACHARGLSFILDVVYNHFGPEGNYVGEFASYFTAKYHTPWGDAIDYEGAPPIRQLVLDNARMWFEDYRVDGLRLDAVHAIWDQSPRHIVADVTSLAHERGRFIIAESDLGDVKVIKEQPAGWGCDAQWSDDFHHALHAVVTGENKAYYADFGAVSQLATAITEGFVYQGQHSPARKQPFGTPSRDLPAERFVVCAQNHDQVGNRAVGERLAHVQPGCEYAVAATVLLAPAVPMIFMGEEHGDPAPFQYFTDHRDAELAQAVRDGRRREFAAFHASAVPDPQAAGTRDRSVIDLGLGDVGRHAGVRRWYRALLQLRRERPELRALDKTRVTTVVDDERGGLVVIHAGTLAVALSLRGRPVELTLPDGSWRILHDAGDERFGHFAAARLDGNVIHVPSFGAVVAIA
ncbi:MAG: malto-oligosyltrehalose trehalohydrolase [Myxococcales bacterium]|nr:malto-oligosyltrehalose trehalohydrolase [Myxococcales bacterium]